MHLAIICGGPSKERGISLNSARSLMDHLVDHELTILYVDYQKRFYLLAPHQLYSNTPSDFDFKLAEPLSKDALISILKQMDLVFPAIHGQFGEDGELQDFLEKNMVPFVGSSSTACKKMFYKHHAAEMLKKNHFETCPFLLINKETSFDVFVEFFQTYERGVIKPSAGGSSIGVSLVKTPQEAFERAHALNDFPVLLEPFLTGKEFTVLIIEGIKGPVALLPSEISIDTGELFDYRRKYLPTANTKWMCPASFSDEVIQNIRKKAEQLFVLFGAKDFARFDGWLLEDGTLLFTDFNPISGMEQNSFLFQQASRIGLSHHDILHFILTKRLLTSSSSTKKKLPILLGGTTAERQVSIMSGTNVWLKLRDDYDTVPCFLDKNYDVWELPYTYALNHTTEEIYDNCLHADELKKRLDYWVPLIREKLDLPFITCESAQKKSFEDFLNEHSAIFIALHGGLGEDGTLQKILDAKGIRYNGSNADASQLCMDKYKTSEKIRALNDPYLVASLQISLSRAELKQGLDYNLCTERLACSSLLIKPRHDGCSTGVFRLRSQDDLNFYISHLDQTFMETDESCIAIGDNDLFVIEPFIQTDFIYVKKHDLIHEHKTGWIELTVGILEEEGCYQVMLPSITVTSGAVLTMEEKFQGGTGINITPPPFISEEGLTRLKTSVGKAAKTLGISNYARLDIFFNLQTHVTHLIEANTLPALTPSTVIYHQALAMDMTPRIFLKRLCKKLTN